MRWFRRRRPLQAPALTPAQRETVDLALREAGTDQGRRHLFDPTWAGLLAEGEEPPDPRPFGL